MYTKHNEDNAQLRIFSFIPQRQRIQANFMNDSIRIFIHTKQLNTHTHSPGNQILQYSFSNSARNWPISYISSITNFVHFIDPHKSVLGLLSNFVHFIQPYMNPLPKWTDVNSLILVFLSLLSLAFNVCQNLF